jgi:hypothetical protein
MRIVTYELEPHELAQCSPDTQVQLALATKMLTAYHDFPLNVALAGSELAFDNILHDVPSRHRIDAVRPHFNASLYAGMYIVNVCLPRLVTRKIGRRFRDYHIVNRLTYDYRLPDEAEGPGAVTLHAAGMTPLPCHDAGQLDHIVSEKMLNGDNVAASIASLLASYCWDGTPEGTHWEFTGLLPRLPLQRSPGV